MAIDASDVLRIARLAHLELGADSVETLRRDLESILRHVAALDDLPPSGADTADAGSPAAVLREDEPREGLSEEGALSNAPDPAAGHFRVPRSFAD